MNKITSTIKYLLSQNKIVIVLAVLLTQWPTLADIEFAILSPAVPRSRVPIVFFYTELVALFIALPLLLFSLKVTGRLKQIFGIIPAIILFFVAVLIVMEFTSTSSGGRPGTHAVIFSFELLLFSIVISLILFVLKGRSTFIEVRSDEPTNSMEDIMPLSEGHQSRTKFCGQCGIEAINSSVFCSSCGSKL